MFVRELSDMLVLLETGEQDIQRPDSGAGADIENSLSGSACILDS